MVRLVAISTPMPVSTTTPTPIHMGGMLIRYAANASPTIRIRKPSRYVEKEDIQGIR